MYDVLSSNEVPIDNALLEKVNPVFHTAKMTLFQLAANGDSDAVMLAKSMGLTQEETQNSENTTALPEQILGGTIMLFSVHINVYNNLFHNVNLSSFKEFSFSYLVYIIPPFYRNVNEQNVF